MNLMSVGVSVILLIGIYHLGYRIVMGTNAMDPRWLSEIDNLASVLAQTGFVLWCFTINSFFELGTDINDAIDRLASKGEEDEHTKRLKELELQIKEAELNMKNKNTELIQVKIDIEKQQL